MVLKQEQIDFFAENGYLSYGKILDDAQIELLRREYDAEFESASQQSSLRNLSGDNGDEKPVSTQMLQIMQMCERNIHFRRLIYNPAILDIVQDLIGPNLMLFHDQALFKPARTGGAVTWHQDNAYWGCRPANLISCWLTLDDVDKENGAMQLIPGSHLKPVWHERRQGSILYDNVEEQVDVSRAVVVDLPAGGCMFHHCQTLHYTQPNATERQRRAFAIHFMQPGTRNGQDEMLRPGFNHPVLRMSI
jgi:ectoine hydroxylase-related dioxygenase (phytanoyl-CoA dioxygenase family)